GCALNGRGLHHAVPADRVSRENLDKAQRGRSIRRSGRRRPEPQEATSVPPRDLARRGPRISAPCARSPSKKDIPLRRHQLTEDGNVVISGRDLRKVTNRVED